jgi:hypothetical protein
VRIVPDQQTGQIKVVPAVGEPLAWAELMPEEAAPGGGAADRRCAPAVPASSRVGAMITFSPTVTAEIRPRCSSATSSTPLSVMT